MPYRIRVTDSAKRELRRLPGHVRQRFIHLIDGLSEEPIPAEARALRGMPDYYRIRILKWRLVYRLEVEAQEVLILALRANGTGDLSGSTLSGGPC